MMFCKFLVRLLGYVMIYWPRPCIRLQGAVLAFLWFDVLRLRRKVALDNLRRAFPEWTEKQRISTARASIANICKGIIEFPLLAVIHAENKKLQDRFEYEGLEHIDRALSLGHGVLFLGLHLGHGDLSISALANRGYPIHLISKRFRWRFLDELWFGVRRDAGVRFISHEKSSFDILKALKKNEIVIFVLDQFMGPPVGVRTQFFGHTTGTAAGLALFHERTQAPVLLTYALRLPGERHRIVIRQLNDGHASVAGIPGQMIQSANQAAVKSKTEVLTSLTQTYTNALEQVIRAYPDQWMWIHRRWKNFQESNH